MGLLVFARFGWQFLVSFVDSPDAMSDALVGQRAKPVGMRCDFFGLLCFLEVVG